MQHLTASKKEAFLSRFNNLRGGELGKVSIISPTTISVRLSVQDETREFDWIDIAFEVAGITDAKMISDSALKAVNMENGAIIEINTDEVKLAFGVEEDIYSAPLYLIGTSLKYEELAFTPF